jgi:hypothetical protein
LRFFKPTHGAKPIVGAIIATAYKQRVVVVRVLEGLGYTYAGDEWQASDSTAPSLVRSATQCMGC